MNQVEIEKGRGYSENSSEGDKEQKYQDRNGSMSGRGATH